MKFQENRIVILGGNGFIGSRLSRMLASSGAAVTCFDRNPAAAKIPGIRYVVGDFFDIDQLTEMIEGCCCIVHAVSSINPGTSQSQYLSGYTKDFAQTARLCDIAWRNRQRLLFLSSGGTVYGMSDTPRKEDDETKPINHYGSVKVCIETMLQTFHQFGADFRIARIANPYGPGQDYRKGVGFVDAAIKHALNGTSIEIWGDGNIIRDYIYIDDVCHMLCDVLAYEGSETIFNIGTGHGISQEDIIEMLRRRFPDVHVEHYSHRAIDVPSIILNMSRYQACFDFRPRSFEAGFHEYVDWLANKIGSNA